MMPTSETSLIRQLSLARATLDLSLDMERNQSDSTFAEKSTSNEIVYTFDESVFELFIGGHDEPEGAGPDARIYQDRRRAVGIFNTREWREAPHIKDEQQRIEFNRQSAILTSEWLFSGALPAMRDGAIHISLGHLQELRSRWDRLLELFRSIARTSSTKEKEIEAVRRLLEDRALSVLGGAGTSGPDDVARYIGGQVEPLQTDLKDYWAALSDVEGRSMAESIADFGRVAFSHRLASELASMRAIGPIAQLVRINRDVAGKLRLLDHAGPIDDIDDFPPSETVDFWRSRIKEEVGRRRAAGLRVGRSDTAQLNDAHALALVQSLANTAARGRDKRRFVLVTADGLLVDVYRSWHCLYAQDYEPFVVRPVRHFSPLLNVVGMTSGSGEGDVELRQKSDIFPALRAAIDPFLLSLNLSIGQGPQRRSSRPNSESETVGEVNRRTLSRQRPVASNDQVDREDDTDRWPREMFSLRMRRLLQAPRSQSAGARAGNEEVIRRELADPRLFPGAHFEILALADGELRRVSGRGRQIERTAIGFGYERLCTRLDALEVAADVLQDFSDKDDTALAAYIREMVDRFGSANLDLRFQVLDIEGELTKVVADGNFRDPGTGRVPLALELHFRDGEHQIDMAARASSMIQQAFERRTGRGQRSRQASFRHDFRGSDLSLDGGYRLYALYACIALRLGTWKLAHHCAAEAERRIRKSSLDGSRDHVEIQYLLALTIRFRLGAGAIRDATGADLSARYYRQARDLLEGAIDAEGESGRFTSIRAAAELVALLIFGSIWTQAAEFAHEGDYPALGPHMDLSELPAAWRLSRMLRNKLRDTNWMADGSSRSCSEIVEQIKVNILAIYCLAQSRRLALVGAHAHELSEIIDDSDMLQWMYDFRDELSSSPATPEITKFYLDFFERLSRRRIGRPPHFKLDLRVDMIVAFLLTTTLIDHI